MCFNSPILHIFAQLALCAANMAKVRTANALEKMRADSFRMHLQNFTTPGNCSFSSGF